MSYVGSYVWQVRQKVGDMRLLVATVDVLVVNGEGKVKLAYVSQIGGWEIVGGHVEYGDTWRTAALHELEEEVGIIAREEDLEPFAAVSGPGWINSYQDGTTQAFSLCFLVRSWEKEVEQTDTEEVSETRWATVEDALDMAGTAWTREVLLAYQKYLETGKFQMVDFK